MTKTTTAARVMVEYVREYIGVPVGKPQNMIDADGLALPVRFGLEAALEARPSWAFIVTSMEIVEYRDRRKLKRKMRRHEAGRMKRAVLIDD